MTVPQLPFVLPVIALALCAGIIAGFHLPVAMVLFPVSAMVTAAGAMVFRRRFTGLASMLLTASVFFLGVALIQHTFLTVSPDDIAASPPENEIALVGRVVDPPLKTETGWRFVLAAEGIELAGGRIEHVTGRVGLRITDKAPDRHKVSQLTWGTWVRVETVLEPVPGYHNAGGYDARLALAVKGIRLTGIVHYTEFLTVLRAGPVWHPMAVMGAVRRDCLGVVDRSAEMIPAAWRKICGVEPEMIRAISRALLLGDRSALGDGVKMDFQAAGLMHILAISGLHVGIIAWLFAVCLRLLPAGFRTRSAAVMILVTGYGILTGGAPPVMRAVLIVDLYLLGKCLNRSVNLLNVLGCAAIILMAANPAVVFSIGFQLTFMATLGIVVLMGPLEILLGWLPGRWVRRAAVVSLAAQCATAPLTAMVFHRIGGWSFLPYILLAPVVTGALGFGIAGLALAAVPGLGAGLMTLHGICVAALAAAARIMAALPGATIRMISPDIVTLALAGSALAALAGVGRIRRMIPVWAVLSILAVVSGLTEPGRLASGPLTICFLDVGNADATLIRMPSGETCLVDTGGIYDSDFDVGRYVVVPALRTLGVRHLDRLFITHAHPDHLGGSFSVIRDFPVGELLVPSRISDNPRMADLLKLAEQRGIPVRELDCSPLVARLTFNTNNHSVVLAVEYGSFRCLLPGDAERESEHALLRYGPSLRSDLLKAAHHGSKTSSTAPFLARVSPSVILIPCGKHNRFGHPHRETLERMEALKPAPLILRSDTVGMVTVVTDGTRCTVTTDWMEKPENRVVQGDPVVTERFFGVNCGKEIEGSS